MIAHSPSYNNPALPFNCRFPSFRLRQSPRLQPSPDVNAAASSSSYTDDVLLGEKLRIRQPARGYRLGLDALLLAAWASRNTPVRAHGLHVLDLCAGTGVVGLAFAVMRNDVAALHAVEANPDMATHLQHNLLQGGGRFSARAEARDLRELRGLQADVILMNPPYFAPGSGRLSPDPYRAMARHQVLGDIDELLAAAVRCMGDNTLFFLAYPPDGMARVEQTLATLDVHLHHRVDVASRADRPPWIRLLAIGRCFSPCTEHSPLVIHGHGASLSSLDLAAILRGDARLWAPQAISSTPSEA